MKRMYVICFRGKRVWWLPVWFPFNSVGGDWEKETTWQEAHHMAAELKQLRDVVDVSVREHA